MLIKTKNSIFKVDSLLYSDNDNGFESIHFYGTFMSTWVNNIGDIQQNFLKVTLEDDKNQKFEIINGSDIIKVNKKKGKEKLFITFSTDDEEYNEEYGDNEEEMSYKEFTECIIDEILKLSSSEVYYKALSKNKDFIYFSKLSFIKIEENCVRFGGNDNEETLPFNENKSGLIDEIIFFPPCHMQDENNIKLVKANNLSNVSIVNRGRSIKNPSLKEVYKFLEKLMLF